MQNLKTTCLDSVCVTLKRVDSLAFPNIYSVLKLFGTLPVIGKLLDTLPVMLVNVNNHSHLFELLKPEIVAPWQMLLFIHREIDLDVSEIIDLFAQNTGGYNWNSCKKWSFWEGQFAKIVRLGVTLDKKWILQEQVREFNYVWTKFL